MTSPIDVYKEENPLRLHSSRVIPLWVDGKPPYRVSITPGTLDFGKKLVGSVTTKEVVITNLGFEPLDLTSVVLSGEGFKITSLVPKSLHAEKSLTILIAFTSPLVKVFLGNLVLDIPNIGQRQVLLRAESVLDVGGMLDNMLNGLWGFLQRATLPALTTVGAVTSLSQTSVEYVDPVDVGMSSGITTITISNAGNQPLVIDNLAISGDFEIVP
jgi:hypothetical protein